MSVFPESIGIIISTYNNPKWLEKCLWGYHHQSLQNLEIVIADDGSTTETRELIDQIIQCTNMNIKHVWQEDQGFQKCQILNKAILAAESEYLIFTDQDCIPREDFVETHAHFAQKGYFLSAGYFKLPLTISQNIKKTDIEKQNVFRIRWLFMNGLKINFKCTKLLKSKFFANLMNGITPAKASWNGCNSSGWKSDFLAINGFNEKMKYGGEDREFGERLTYSGIRSKQIRYSAICVHLYHDRPYKKTEIILENKAIRKQTKKTQQTFTDYGILKNKQQE